MQRRALDAGRHLLCAQLAQLLLELSHSLLAIRQVAFLALTVPLLGYSIPLFQTTSRHAPVFRHITSEIYSGQRFILSALNHGFVAVHFIEFSGQSLSLV